MARKAADLYQQQQAIEQLVTQRWDSASNGSGGPVQQLPAVQIDKFGRFPFVLAKAGDRLGARKLLVRGRNGATEAQLVNNILKEVRRLSHMGWRQHAGECNGVKVAQGGFVSKGKYPVCLHLWLAAVGGRRVTQRFADMTCVAM